MIIVDDGNMLRSAAKVVWTYSMPLFVVACAVVVALRARLVFDAVGAVAFGTLATAWLLLARPIVGGMLGRLLRGWRPARMAVVIPHLLVDVAAMLGAVAIQPQLAWATLAGIAFSEVFYAVVGREKS